MQGVKHMLYRESTMFTHSYKLVRIDDSLECARVCAHSAHMSMRGSVLRPEKLKV